MKVVILAGGLGTRISDYTKFIPKPMIKIKGLPILVHIMNHYSKFGFKEFYIALGYKGNVIKNYFKNNKFNWKINLVDTGKNTMTGGRLKRLAKYLKGENFFLTYGDGLSDVNILNLLKFHKKNKKLVTVTAVRPPARFGALKLKGNSVSYFKEKSRMDEGWINGGFFVISEKFLSFIRNDKTFLEREPLEKVAKLKELSAYRHNGFWQCIDNMRDLIYIKKKNKREKNYTLKKKILILGGTGFIGYYLAKEALKKGFQVSSLSKNKPVKKRYLKKVKYIIADISNKNLIKKKIKEDFEYVVNLAGYVNHSNKAKTYKSHYIGCKNISNFFLQKNIKRFIQVGSSMEYGLAKSPQNETFKCKPKSIYGQAKFLSTKHLLNLYRKKNFPVTIIRPYQVYGPYQDLNRFIPIVINSCKYNKNFPCSHGRQFRDFLYISDFTDAIFLILKNPKAEGEIFNIGSGWPLKIMNIIKKIVKCYKSGNPQFNKIKLRKEEQMKIYSNIYKAKKILNWKPKVKFLKGLAKTIEYYNAH